MSNTDISIERERSSKRIAVIVQAVKLTEDEPGLDRAEYVASMLSRAGYQVDLITSRFQHWQKARRDVDEDYFSDRPYQVVFLEEPGYKRNIDLGRIMSHATLADSLDFHLRHSEGEYDCIWTQIPPNNTAAAAAKFAKREGIPLVVDVNDLWPDAMRMAINIPILSDIAFYPFERDAKKVFAQADAVVGTSQEYARHPNGYRVAPLDEDRSIVVYVGTDLDAFDQEAADNEVTGKPDEEIWVSYAGTLGKSYDIETLIRAVGEASAALSEAGKRMRLIVMGDGPDRERLENIANEVTKEAGNCQVRFMGYLPHGTTAAYLAASDIVVNSLVKAAPQSIVSKIADYLASESAMINTGTSPEMRELVDRHGFGVNVSAEDIAELAEALTLLSNDNEQREKMACAGRALAERDFDRKKSYAKVLELMDDLLLK